MSTLDDIFEAPETGEVEENPRLKLNYKEDESVRFRLLADLKKSKKYPDGPKMKVMVRHYVKGVGYVECGQPIGTKKQGDQQVPVLWPSKFVDGEKVVACQFCQERKQFKAENGGENMSKEKNREFGQLHRRKVDIIAPAEGEVRDANGKVIQPLHPMAIVFNGIDLFFPQQQKQYKQLEAKFKKKGTLRDTWMTMGSDGMIDFDDKVTTEEHKRKVEVDLSFFDRQTKSYEEGLKVYLNKSAAQSEATPQEDESQNEPEKEDPPFDLDDDEAPVF